MTLLSVIRDVCAAVGVLVPQSVFSNLNANRTMQEMLALANEMAQRIAYDEREWNKFKTTVTYPGDGVATAFALPADYQRMLLTSNVWRSTSTLYPMRFVPDMDEWLNRRARNYHDGRGEWTMFGGQLQIAPVLATGESVYFPYLNRNCVTLASGGGGDHFIADGDSYVLDERLLKLGMIWQWKAQKGSPYQEDMGNYSTALAFAEAHDSPAPIMVGRKPMAAGTRIAYPFPVPTP